MNAWREPDYHGSLSPRTSEHELFAYWPKTLTMMLVILDFSLWPIRNYRSLWIVLNRFAHSASPGYTTCDSWAAAQSLGTDVCFQTSGGRAKFRDGRSLIFGLPPKVSEPLTIWVYNIYITRVGGWTPQGSALYNNIYIYYYIIYILELLTPGVDRR